MKIICVGRNYAEHAKELQNAVPDKPLLFLKPSSSLLHSPGNFPYPTFSQNIHYECEIVLRISKKGKNIPEAEAAGYFDAVTTGIDFTARDLQDALKAKGQPWEVAKAFDNAAVLGTFIPTQEALTAEGSIAFSLLKNGALVQDGNTNDLIFSFGYLLHYISIFFTLEPGDLVYTGTPAGVGPVQVGDQLDAFIGKQKLLSCSIV